MKHKLIFLAVMFTAMTLPAVAQNTRRMDPDHANYSIIGTMKVEDGNRYLIGATGKKIDFTFKGRRFAQPTQMADLVVRFDSVKTDHPGGMTPLDFWRYDTEIGEWIYDREVRQGEQQMESTMKTNIMLVIDNSRSLAEDFKKVQDAAVEFVGQLYRESQGKEIFRVGVIGFSTVKFTRIRQISSLTSSNYHEIVSFIRSLEMQNGTALYYSLETALNMLEEDAQNNIAADEYKESRIYAFTDGLDQASVDDTRKLSTPTEYYDYLRPMMKGASREKINNRIIRSTIVTVRGGDMTDGQERQFDQRAQAICDDVRKLRDMSRLVSEFKKLAEDLVKSNQVLYCYIPVGANGRVGWTFAEDVVRLPDPPRPKKTSDFWMGIKLSGAFGWFEDEQYYSYDGHYEYNYDDHMDLLLGFDAIWPLSAGFGIGGSADAGWNFEQWAFNFRLGVLTKFTFTNNSALLLGFGISNCLDDHLGAASYFSLGWKFKSPWYIDAKYYYNRYAERSRVIGIGIGYSICGGRK